MEEGAAPGQAARHRQSPAGNALPSPSIYTPNPSPSCFRSRSRRCALPKPLLPRPPSQRTISMCSFSAVCEAPTISRLPFPSDAIAGNPLYRSIEALYPKRRSRTPVMMWNCVLIVKQFHARATKPPHLPLRILSDKDGDEVSRLLEGEMRRGLRTPTRAQAMGLCGARRRQALYQLAERRSQGFIEIVRRYPLQTATAPPPPTRVRPHTCIPLYEAVSTTLKPCMFWSRERHRPRFDSNS